MVTGEKGQQICIFQNPTLLGGSQSTKNKQQFSIKRQRSTYNISKLNQKSHKQQIHPQQQLVQQEDICDKLLKYENFCYDVERYIMHYNEYNSGYKIIKQDYDKLFQHIIFMQEFTPQQRESIKKMTMDTYKPQENNSQNKISDIDLDGNKKQNQTPQSQINADKLLEMNQRKIWKKAHFDYFIKELLNMEKSQNNFQELKIFENIHTSDQKEIVRDLLWQEISYEERYLNYTKLYKYRNIFQIVVNDLFYIISEKGKLKLFKTGVTIKQKKSDNKQNQQMGNQEQQKQTQNLIQQLQQKCLKQLAFKAIRIKEDGEEEYNVNSIELKQRDYLKNIYISITPDKPSGSGLQIISNNTIPKEQMYRNIYNIWIAQLKNINSKSKQKMEILINDKITQMMKQYFKTTNLEEEDNFDLFLKLEQFCEYFEFFVSQSRNKQKDGEKEHLSMYDYGGYFRNLVAEYDKVNTTKVNQKKIQDKKEQQEKQINNEDNNIIKEKSPEEMNQEKKDEEQLQNQETKQGTNEQNKEELKDKEPVKVSDQQLLNEEDKSKNNSSKNMFPNESNKKLLLKTKREELLEIDKSITSLYSHKKKVESKDEGKKLTVAQQREKKRLEQQKEEKQKKKQQKKEEEEQEEERKQWKIEHFKYLIKKMHFWAVSEDMDDFYFFENCDSQTERENKAIELWEQIAYDNKNLGYERLFKFKNVFMLILEDLFFLFQKNGQITFYNNTYTWFKKNKSEEEKNYIRLKEELLKCMPNLQFFDIVKGEDGQKSQKITLEQKNVNLEQFTDQILSTIDSKNQYNLDKLFEEKQGNNEKDEEEKDDFSESENEDDSGDDGKASSGDESENSEDIREREREAKEEAQRKKKEREKEATVIVREKEEVYRNIYNIWVQKLGEIYYGDQDKKQGFVQGRLITLLNNNFKSNKEELKIRKRIENHLLKRFSKNITPYFNMKNQFTEIKKDYNQQFYKKRHSSVLNSVKKGIKEFGKNFLSFEQFIYFIITQPEQEAIDAFLKSQNTSQMEKEVMLDPINPLKKFSQSQSQSQQQSSMLLDQQSIANLSTDRAQDILWSIFRGIKNLDSILGYQDMERGKLLQAQQVQLLIDIDIICYDLFLLLDDEWNQYLKPSHNFFRKNCLNHAIQDMRIRNEIDLQSFHQLMTSNYTKSEILEIWQEYYIQQTKVFWFPECLTQYFKTQRYSSSKQRFLISELKLEEEKIKQFHFSYDQDSEEDEDEEDEEKKREEKLKKEEERRKDKYYARSPLTAVLEFALLGTDVFDYVSDFIVIMELYKFANDPETEQRGGYMLFTIAYSICELSPYLISYSSGIQLFQTSRFFEKDTKSIWTKFQKALILSPLGAFYFLFLHFLEVMTTFIQLIIQIPVFNDRFFRRTMNVLESLPQKFGISEHDFSGYKLQKRMAQLMFESFPIGLMNFLLLFKIINLKDLQGSQLIILLSTIGTFLKITKELFLLFNSAYYLKEGLVQYGLTMMKARYNWLPFSEQIGYTNVNYSHICYPGAIGAKQLGIYTFIPFQFSNLGISELSELIYRLPGKMEKRIQNYELIETQVKNYYKNTELIQKIKDELDKRKNPDKYKKKKQQEQEENEEEENVEQIIEKNKNYDLLDSDTEDFEFYESGGSDMEDELNPNQTPIQNETLQNLQKRLKSLEVEHKQNMKEFKQVCKQLKLKLDLNRQKSINIEYVREQKRYVRQTKSIELENNLNNVSHIQVLKFLKLVKEYSSTIKSHIQQRIHNQLARLLNNTYQQLKANLEDKTQKPGQMLPWGQSIIHWAIDSQDDYPDKITATVIERFNPDQYDQAGRHPLYYAAQQKKLKSFKNLLKNGADIEIRTKYTDETVLYYLIQNGRQEDGDEVKMFDSLLEVYRNPDNRIEIDDDINQYKADQYNGNTPLIQAIKLKKQKTVLKIIQLTGKVNDRNQNNESALYYLCQEGRLDEKEYKQIFDKLYPAYKRQFDLKELREFKKDMYDGQTPLMRSMEYKKQKTFETVLKLTKSVSDKNQYNISPLYYVVSDGKLENEQYQNYFDLFIKDYSKQLDFSELKKFKNGWYENNTPMLGSLTNKSMKTFETLLELVKSVNDRGKRRETPLFWLCQDGRLEEDEYMAFLKKLLEHPTLSKQLKFKQLKKSKKKLYDEFTPLINSMSNQKPKAFDTILGLVKSVRDRTKNGTSPLQYLIQNGRLENEKNMQFFEKLINSEYKDQINWNDLITYDLDKFSGFTPIQSAIQKQSIKTFDILIQQFKEKNKDGLLSPNYNGEIPLTFLIREVHQFIKNSRIGELNDEKKIFHKMFKKIMDIQWEDIQKKDPKYRIFYQNLSVPAGFFIRSYRVIKSEEREDREAKERKEKEKERKRLKKIEEKLEEVSDSDDNEPDLTEEQEIEKDSKYNKSQNIIMEEGDTEAIYITTLNGLILESFQSNMLYYFEELFLWKHPRILTEKQKEKIENDKKEIENIYQKGDPFQDYKFNLKFDFQITHREDDQFIDFILANLKANHRQNNYLIYDMMQYIKQNDKLLFLAEMKDKDGNSLLHKLFSSNTRSSQEKENEKLFQVLCNIKENEDYEFDKLSEKQQDEILTKKLSDHKQKNTELKKQGKEEEIYIRKCPLDFTIEHLKIMAKTKNYRGQSLIDRAMEYKNSIYDYSKRNLPEKILKLCVYQLDSKITDKGLKCFQDYISTKLSFTKKLQIIHPSRVLENPQLSFFDTANLQINSGILDIIHKEENKIDQNTFYQMTLKPKDLGNRNYISLTDHDQKECLKEIKSYEVINSIKNISSERIGLVSEPTINLQNATHINYLKPEEEVDVTEKVVLDLNQDNIEDENQEEDNNNENRKTPKKKPIAQKKVTFYRLQNGQGWVSDKLLQGSNTSPIKTLDYYQQVEKQLIEFGKNVLKIDKDIVVSRMEIANNKNKEIYQKQRDKEDLKKKEEEEKEKAGLIVPPPKQKYFTSNHNEKLEKRSWFNMLAIVVFLLELVSLLDMFTDLYILSQLIGSVHAGWATSMMLCMLSPYLIMYAPLVSYLIRKNIFVGTLGKTFGLFFLSILSLIFIFILDFFSAIFSLLSNLISPFSTGSGDDLIEIIFIKIGFSTMDIIGIRKLRSISQLLFETTPQLFLQLRMLTFEESQEFGVNVESIMISLSFALTHFFVEATVLYLESRAYKSKFVAYISTCLNGRLLWIPYTDLLMNPKSSGKGKKKQRQKQIEPDNNNEKQDQYQEQDDDDDEDEQNNNVDENIIQNNEQGQQQNEIKTPQKSQHNLDDKSDVISNLNQESLGKESENRGLLSDKQQNSSAQKQTQQQTLLEKENGGINHDHIVLPIQSQEDKIIETKKNQTLDNSKKNKLDNSKKGQLENSKQKQVELDINTSKFEFYESVSQNCRSSGGSQTKVITKKISDSNKPCLIFYGERDEESGEFKGLELDTESDKKIRWGVKYIKGQNNLFLGISHLQTIQKNEYSVNISDLNSGLYCISGNKYTLHNNDVMQNYGLLNCTFEFKEGDIIQFEFVPKLGQLICTIMKTFVQYTINKISIYPEHPLYITSIHYQEDEVIQLLSEQELDNEYEIWKEKWFNYDDINVKVCNKYKNKVDYLFSEETLTKLSYSILDLPQESNEKDISNYLIVDESMKNVSIQALCTFIQFSEKRIWLNYQKVNFDQILNNKRTFDIQFVSQNKSYVEQNIVPQIQHTALWASYRIKFFLKLYSDKYRINVNQQDFDNLQTISRKMEKILNVMVNKQKIQQLILSKDQLANIQAEMFYLDFKKIQQNGLYLIETIYSNLSTIRFMEIHKKGFDDPDNFSLMANIITILNIFKQVKVLRFELECTQNNYKAQDVDTLLKKMEVNCLKLNYLNFKIKDVIKAELNYSIFKFEISEKVTRDYHFILDTIHKFSNWSMVKQITFVFNNQTLKSVLKEYLKTKNSQDFHYRNLSTVIQELQACEQYEEIIGFQQEILQKSPKMFTYELNIVRELELKYEFGKFTINCFNKNKLVKSYNEDARQYNLKNQNKKVQLRELLIEKDYPQQNFYPIVDHIFKLKRWKKLAKLMHMNLNKPTLEQFISDFKNFEALQNQKKNPYYNIQQLHLILDDNHNMVQEIEDYLVGILKKKKLQKFEYFIQDQSRILLSDNQFNLRFFEKSKIDYMVFLSHLQSLQQWNSVSYSQIDLMAISKVSDQMEKLLQQTKNAYSKLSHLSLNQYTVKEDEEENQDNNDKDKVHKFDSIEVQKFFQNIISNCQKLINFDYVIDKQINIQLRGFKFKLILYKDNTNDFNYILNPLYQLDCWKDVTNFEYSFRMENLDSFTEEFLKNISAFKNITSLTITYTPYKPENQPKYIHSDNIMKSFAQIIKNCPKLTYIKFEISSQIYIQINASKFYVVLQYYNQHNFNHILNEFYKIQSFQEVNYFDLRIEYLTKLDEYIQEFSQNIGNRLSKYKRLYLYIDQEFSDTDPGVQITQGQMEEFLDKIVLPMKSLTQLQINKSSEMDISMEENQSGLKISNNFKIDYNKYINHMFSLEQYKKVKDLALSVDCKKIDDKLQNIKKNLISNIGEIKNLSVNLKKDPRRETECYQYVRDILSQIKNITYFQFNMQNCIKLTMNEEDEKIKIDIRDNLQNMDVNQCLDPVYNYPLSDKIKNVDFSLSSLSRSTKIIDQLTQNVQKKFGNVRQFKVSISYDNYLYYPDYQKYVLQLSQGFKQVKSFQFSDSYYGKLIVSKKTFQLRAQQDFCYQKILEYIVTLNYWKTVRKIDMRFNYFQNMLDAVLDKKIENSFKKAKSIDISIDRSASREELKEKKNEMIENIQKITDLSDNLTTFKLKYGDIYKINLSKCKLYFKVEHDDLININILSPLYKLPKWNKYRYLELYVKDVQRVKDVLYPNGEDKETPFKDFSRFNMQFYQTVEETKNEDNEEEKLEEEEKENDIQLQENADQQEQQKTDHDLIFKEFIESLHQKYHNLKRLTVRVPSYINIQQEYAIGQMTIRITEEQLQKYATDILSSYQQNKYWQQYDKLDLSVQEIELFQDIFMNYYRSDDASVKNPFSHLKKLELTIKNKPNNSRILERCFQNIIQTCNLNQIYLTIEGQVQLRVYKNYMDIDVLDQQASKYINKMIQPIYQLDIWKETNYLTLKMGVSSLKEILLKYNKKVYKDHSPFINIRYLNIELQNYKDIQDFDDEILTKLDNLKTYSFSVQNQIDISVKKGLLNIEIKNDNIQRFNKALTPIYNHSTLMDNIKSLEMKLNTVIILNELLSEFQDVEVYPFRNIENIRSTIVFNFDKSKQIDDALWIGMLKNCQKLKQFDFGIDLQLQFRYKDNMIQCVVEDQHQINFSLNKLLYPLSNIPIVAQKVQDISLGMQIQPKFNTTKITARQKRYLKQQQKKFGNNHRSFFHRQKLYIDINKHFNIENFQNLQNLSLILNSYKFQYNKGPKLVIKKDNWAQIQSLLKYKGLKQLELDYKDFKFTRDSHLDNIRNSLAQSPDMQSIKLNLFKEDCLTDETFALVVEEILKLKSLNEVTLNIALGDHRLGDITPLQKLIASEHFKKLTFQIHNVQESQLSMFEDSKFKTQELMLVFKAHKSVKIDRQSRFEENMKKSIGDCKLNIIWNFFVPSKMYSTLKIRDLNTIVCRSKQSQGRIAMQNQDLDLNTDFTLEFQILNLSPNSNIALGCGRKKWVEQEFYYTNLETESNNKMIENMMGVHQILQQTYKLYGELDYNTIEDPVQKEKREKEQKEKEEQRKKEEQEKKNKDTESDESDNDEKIEKKEFEDIEKVKEQDLEDDKKTQDNLKQSEVYEDLEKQSEDDKKGDKEVKGIQKNFTILFKNDSESKAYDQVTVEIYDSLNYQEQKKKAISKFNLHMEKEFKKGNNYNPVIIIQNKQDNGIETAIRLKKYDRIVQVETSEEKNKK